MKGPLEDSLQRWRNAGLIDTATAGRILEFEAARAGTGHGTGSRGATLAFGLGALALAAGIILYVAAHWDWLSPLGRSTVLIAAIAALHGGAGLAARRKLPALTTALHAAGTAAFGAGIFLMGQTFHLAESWPEGFLLWALGAVIALYVLRDWPHVLWVALLVPAWLVAEWAARQPPHQTAVATLGLLTLSLAYLGSTGPLHQAAWRAALSRLGAAFVLPLGVLHAFASMREVRVEDPIGDSPSGLLLLGWSIAVLLPIAVAWALRRREAWPVAMAAVLGIAVVLLGHERPLHELLLYAIYACGSIGIVLWGLRDAERLRVNVGILCFAATLLFFYFDSLFGRLGRALGLVGVGLLLIGGGWLLERTRRRLLASMEGNRQ